MKTVSQARTPPPSVYLQSNDDISSGRNPHATFRFYFLLEFPYSAATALQFITTSSLLIDRFWSHYRGSKNRVAGGRRPPGIVTAMQHQQRPDSYQKIPCRQLVNSDWIQRTAHAYHLKLSGRQHTYQIRVGIDGVKSELGRAGWKYSDLFFVCRSRIFACAQGSERYRLQS
jgi:hypothetical protein